MKYCRRCQSTKPRKAFGARKNAGDGLQSYCRACFAAVMRERRTRSDVRASENAYMRFRYQTDPDYRQRQIDRVRARRAGGCT